MAMRPRGGGAAAPRRGARSSGAVRPVYEEFRPMSEWQQDDEFHILNIYLPGFMKEQIRVSTEGRNTIRVGGERLVAGNKWNRFQEDFQVPENGEMNSVRAKFQGGILVITVPKVRVDALIPPKTDQAKIDDTQKQLTPDQTAQQKVSPETTHEKDTETQKTSIDSTKKQSKDGDQKQLTPQKDQDRDFPVVGIKQSTEEKSSEKDDDQRGRSFTLLRRTVVSDDVVKKGSDESKEKHVPGLERRDDVRETAGDKDGKKSIVETKLEGDGERRTAEKTADSKELYGAAYTKEKYKKAVKGLTELNEERQLLVNMGVAMLVVVALTAYVTYSFASAKDKN